jgi:hypothetical protein
MVHSDLWSPPSVQNTPASTGRASPVTARTNARVTSQRRAHTMDQAGLPWPSDRPRHVHQGSRQRRTPVTPMAMKRKNGD